MNGRRCLLVACGAAAVWLAAPGVGAGPGRPERPARWPDPRQTASRELLVEAEIRQGDLDAADRRLAELQARTGDTGLTWGFRRAEVRFLRGDVQAAAAQLDSLLAAEPAHDLANDALELLLACEALGADTVSRAPYTAACLAERQLDPERARPAWDWLADHASAPVAQLALRAQARARLAAGDVDGARRLSARLAAGYPAGPFRTEALTLEADALEAAGRQPEALDLLEEALLATPDDAQAPAIRLRVEALRRLLPEAAGADTLPR